MKFNPLLCQHWLLSRRTQMGWRGLNCMCFFNYNNISHNNTKQLKKRNIEKYINGVRNRVEFQVKNWKKKKRCANCTRCSQAVTHPSTNRARRCLTSVIGREPVFSTWYGRRQERSVLYAFWSAKAEARLTWSGRLLKSIPRPLELISDEIGAAPPPIHIPV